MSDFFARFHHLIRRAPDTGAGGEVAPEASVEDRAEHILSLLGDEDDGPGATEDPAAGSADGASAKTEAETVTTEEPAPPAIAPPPTWKAELKEQWTALPPALQRDLAQWETERNQGFNLKLEESASERKAAEAERLAIHSERQRYAHILQTIVAQAQTDDPILAQGARVDWTRLAQDDPAAYVQFRAQYDAAAQRRQVLQQEHQRVQEAERNDYLAQQQKLLTDKLPAWSDGEKRKALAAEIAGYLKSVGFSEDEIRRSTDHRALVVANEVLSLRRQLAERATQDALSEKTKASVSAKKAAPVPVVIKPGAQRDTGPDARVESLKKSAIRSGRTDDLAAAIMAAL